MRKILNLSFITLITINIIPVASCKKLAPALRTNATIINSGPVAADGCGWLVKINASNTEYSPSNLSAAFQKDSLSVSISYTLLTTRFGCGMLANNGGLPMIEIKSITKVN
jgi:hypothetical protein